MHFINQIPVEEAITKDYIEDLVECRGEIRLELNQTVDPHHENDGEALGQVDADLPAFIGEAIGYAIFHWLD